MAKMEKLRESCKRTREIPKKNEARGDNLRVKKTFQVTNHVPAKDIIMIESVDAAAKARNVREAMTKIANPLQI